MTAALNVKKKRKNDHSLKFWFRISLTLLFQGSKVTNNVSRLKKIIRCGKSSNFWICFVVRG